jgi:acyl-CoA dehydrogenase
MRIPSFRVTRLKFEEMLSGRFADAFGTLYLGYACLWYYKQHMHVEGIDAVLELSMEMLLQQNQVALQGIAANFPVKGIGAIMRGVCFPTGAPYTGPTDTMRQKASQLITNPSGIRDLLSEGIFISDDPNDRLRMLNDILPQAVAADKAVSEAKKAKRDLTPDEKALVSRVTEIVNELVQVSGRDGRTPIAHPNVHTHIQTCTHTCLF